MTQTRAQSMLKTGAILVMFFGVLTASLCLPCFGALADLMVDGLFWPFDGTPKFEGQAATLLAGIAGGVMFGWGVLLWFVATKTMLHDPVAGKTMIQASLLSWFAVDSVASLFAGAPLNVVSNLVFLAIFLLPLVGRSKDHVT